VNEGGEGELQLRGTSPAQRDPSFRIPVASDGLGLRSRLASPQTALLVLTGPWARWVGLGASFQRITALHRLPRMPTGLFSQPLSARSDHTLAPWPLTSAKRLSRRGLRYDPQDRGACFTECEPRFMTGTPRCDQCCFYIKSCS
jgi:hypothetical protein